MAGRRSCVRATERHARTGRVCMIVLDTNVVSEAFRKAPNATVRTWLDAQAPTDLFLCAPVLAELRYGIERLAPGARKTALEEMLLNVETELFDNRILSF